MICNYLNCCKNCRSSYSDFAQKYGKEDKFKAIEKNKERESLFNEFIIEVRKREREEKIHQKEMVIDYAKARICWIIIVIYIIKSRSKRNLWICYVKNQK